MDTGRHRNSVALHFSTTNEGWYLYPTRRNLDGIPGRKFGAWADLPSLLVSQLGRSVATVLATRPVTNIGQDMVCCGQRAIVAVIKRVLEAIGLRGLGSGCPCDTEVGVKGERVGGLHFIAQIAYREKMLSFA